MKYEIEKKFVAPSFSKTLTMLQEDFGEFKHHKKIGFWWCNNYTDLENILDVTDPKITKKNVAIIKDIGEFTLDIQNYQFLRLRIYNNTRFVVTLKNKQLLNKIEQNIEFEFDTSKSIFKKIVLYLIDTSSIFYYNIKESWQFKKDDFKIEISKFNDLREPYIEVETMGKEKIQLTDKLNEFLTSFDKYSLRDEERNYSEISKFENGKNLEHLKLSSYSREAIKELKKLI